MSGPASSDHITLKGLRVQANHGVLATEREHGQIFVIDVVAYLDLAPASHSDVLAKTVDYGQLSQEIYRAVAGDPVDLIETVAERVATVALRHRAIDRVEVTVHKPQAPITVEYEDVSVTIVRERP